VENGGNQSRHSLSRRDFIKSVSLAGASMAVSASAGNAAVGTENDAGIGNEHFTVSFDGNQGTYAIRRGDGTPLVTNGTTAVNFRTDTYPLATGDFKHSVQSTRFSDRLGSGDKLTVTSTDANNRINIELNLALYDHLPAIVLEVRCTNVSEQDMIIHGIEPLRVAAAEGGILHAPGVTKCITNGQMYFDDGTIHVFGDREGGVASSALKGVRLSNEPFPGPNETIHSWWNAGLFSGYDEGSIALGWLANDLCLGTLLMSRPAPGQISLIAESVYAPGVALKAGSTIGSNRFLINIAASPYAALERYAEAVGQVNDARAGSRINGWCSWFYTLAQVSEAEVLENAAFAAKHLKPYGLEYIQVDEGYQKWHGDWEGNERFPGGMKRLADRIKRHGFKAGIWISPYVISEPTAVFRDHKDWLLKNPDGSLQRVGNWPEGAEPPADENPKRYGLDITHPGAARWLHDLVDLIANDWGYEMIKIDFVAWSVLAAKQYYDPTLSSAEVYRRGMEIMRKAAGDRCHILECGPGAITVGLIDSMRIELDVNYGFADAAWNTYFLDPACSASAAGKRYYFHNRTWTNDVDHLCTHLLTNDQSEAAATIIAMSGGNMMSGDRLVQLDPYKLDILRKITPSYGVAATPIDLFDADIQTSFVMKVEKPFGAWTIAAFFNPDLTEPIEKSFSMKRLGLDGTKTYLAYDFWRQQFMGEVSGEITARIPPGSVRLISLHEKKGRPQLIGTDRHVLQGAIEIEHLEWDESTKALSGTSAGPPGTSHNVYVYVPGDHPWTWGGYVLFRDYESFTLKLVHSNIIQVHVRFDASERTPWRINVDEFFRAA
jgi:alpha-galactosidase